jgi:hypothetical protein
MSSDVRSGVKVGLSTVPHHRRYPMQSFRSLSSLPQLTDKTWGIKYLDGTSEL